MRKRLDKIGLLTVMLLTIIFAFLAMPSDALSDDDVDYDLLSRQICLECLATTMASYSWYTDEAGGVALRTQEEADTTAFLQDRIIFWRELCVTLTSITGSQCVEAVRNRFLNLLAQLDDDADVSEVGETMKDCEAFIEGFEEGLQSQNDIYDVPDS